VPGNEWAQMVTVGRIVRPHGHRGQVVVASETDFGAERFGVGATVFAMRAEAIAPLRVIASRAHDGRWVVGFDSIQTMNDAEAFRDVELRIPADAVKALEGGRYYVHELVGCRVETIDGRVIGNVGRVQLDTGTPLLVVESRRGEVLVPLAETICRRIDVVGRVVVIEPPEGLIELNL
jgi:16S rRNA processing protein RimM